MVRGDASATSQVLAAKARAARTVAGGDCEDLVLPLAGALRALRRSGSDLSSSQAQDAVDALGLNDKRLTLGFDDFLRLHDWAKRTRRVDKTRRYPRPPGRFNAAAAGSRLVVENALTYGPGRSDARPRRAPAAATVAADRGSLLAGDPRGNIISPKLRWTRTRPLKNKPGQRRAPGRRLVPAQAATLGMQLLDDDGGAGAGDDDEKAKENAEAKDAEEEDARAPPTVRSKMPTVDDAFLKFDLYGDRLCPGEISWTSLPAVIATARGGGRAPSARDCARAAAELDIPPHYPVDLATTKKLLSALKGTDRRRRDDFDQQRRTAAKTTASRKNAPVIISETPGLAAGDDVAPMMDPETRSLRRVAVRRSHGPAPGAGQ